MIDCELELLAGSHGKIPLKVEDNTIDALMKNIKYLMINIKCVLAVIKFKIYLSCAAHLYLKIGGMYMNTDMEKIQKSSSAALIIARICKIFCIAMATLAFVIGILFVSSLNDYVNEAIGTLGEDVSVFVSDNMGMFLGIGNRLVQQSDNNAIILGVYMIIIGVYMTILAVLMHYIGEVFKDIKEGYSPFRLSIVKNMKIVFVIITLCSLNNSLLFGALIGFSLWCVVYVFQYGCELQRESDETL